MNYKILALLPGLMFSSAWSKGAAQDIRTDTTKEVSGLMNIESVSEATLIPQVGSHYKLFTFEKNESPENIMVFYTKLDGSCHFLTEEKNANEPIFDSYWLMGAKNFKPVHPMIKNGMRDRLQVVPSSHAQSFFVRINDLKEVDTDIQDARLEVTSKSDAGGKCKVEVTMNLGPSDKNVKIYLKTIYSEAVKMFLPPFRRLVSITLKGTNAKTGEKISRKYLAKTRS